MKAKRFFLMLLVALISVTGAWAQTSYVDADGRVKTVIAREITSTSTPLSDGWYVVTDADKQTSFITCSGDVHIIIADGAKLTVTSSTKKRAGIIVTGSLSIYGQSNQTGQLIVFGGEEAAGIGGNSGMAGSNITINGGVVTANGGEEAAGIGGGKDASCTNITINGGTVTANGGSQGAGIGGGHFYTGSSSYITINGGTVTANGGDGGAGIGGGDGGAGSYITINGGTVTANSVDGAGIGGGSGGAGSYITINGGTVTANGGYLSAGIGGGFLGSGSYITINGGIVTATSDDGSGIGSGIHGGTCSNIFVTPTLRVRADDNNPPVNVIAHSSITEDISSSLNGKRFARITDLPFFYICSSDESKGVVFGSANDEYVLNTTLRFCAIPADGFKFKGWSDGNTENPRQHTLTDDTSITANFEKEFQDPTSAGMRLRVKKTDGKTYEFSTSELKKVDYYRSTKVSE